MKYKYFNSLDQSHLPIEEVKDICFLNTLSYIENISYEQAEDIVYRINPEDIFFKTNGYKGVSDYTIEEVAWELWGKELEGTYRKLLVKEWEEEGLWVIACSKGNSSHITVIDEFTLIDISKVFLDYEIDYIIDLN